MKLDLVAAQNKRRAQMAVAVAQAREERIKLTLLAWADGALDEATLQSELDEERDILRMEFLAIQVLTKKAAQDAANAMFKVIEDALLAGIGLVA